MPTKSNRFNPVRIDGLYDFDKVATVLNRIQNAISVAFDVNPDNQPTVTGPVRGEYKATDSDQYILVDSNSGPVSVILPVPGLKQIVTVHNSRDSKNTVTVKRSDGKSINLTERTVNIPALTAAQFVTDGSDWFKLWP